MSVAQGSLPQQDDQEVPTLPETARAVVFLDIDRTCLDTDRWLMAVAQYLAWHYPDHVVNPDEFVHDRRAFYQVSRASHELPQYYTIGAQIAHCGLDLQRILSELAVSDNADGRLQYPGLAELIQALRAQDYAVYTLTYGDDATQRLKVAMCPALRGVDCITTRDRKSTDIARCVRHWQRAGRRPASLYMVDDKPAIGRDMQQYNKVALTNYWPKVHFIQIDHRPTDEVQPPDGVDHHLSWPICHTLAEVKTIITQGAH